ncbi:MULTISPECIES: DUF3427 domain-containing protein [Bacillus]|nr:MULTISPECIES: DUF3427 domain-containing protein [Bacillus]MEC2215923.1 DUF3427 domain-containing protein [Bacillus velezensis]
MMKYNFIKGKLYTRKSIFQIIDLPLEKQKGGNWFTGYTSYNNDNFLFVNLGKGRTGHNHSNKLNGKCLDWYGKLDSKLTHPSIQRMVSAVGYNYFFVREDSNDPHFKFMGKGIVQQVFNEIPVRILWHIE